MAECAVPGAVLLWGSAVGQAGLAAAASPLCSPLGLRLLEPSGESPARLRWEGWMSPAGLFPPWCPRSQLASTKVGGG